MLASAMAATRGRFALPSRRFNVANMANIASIADRADGAHVAAPWGEGIGSRSSKDSGAAGGSAWSGGAVAKKASSTSLHTLSQHESATLPLERPFVVLFRFFFAMGV